MRHRWLAIALLLAAGLKIAKETDVSHHHHASAVPFFALNRRIVWTTRERLGPLHRKDGQSLLVCVAFKPSKIFTSNNLQYRYATTDSKSASSKWHRTLLLRWVPLPVGLGLAVVAYQQYKLSRARKALHEGPLASEWEIACYRLLPLKTMSRVWGWVNDLELPRWARKPLLSLYIRSFGCNLEEAEVQDLRQYRNLGEFFRRPIKASSRPVDPSDCVVSPADGTVLHFGEVEQCRLEQVKGVVYSLMSFMGPLSWCQNGSSDAPIAGPEYERTLMTDPSRNNLYHCIIYLAPGDYHRFHSPVEWEVIFRRHFSGELFSVSPGIARWIAGLFSLNERAVYVGRWKHGFFSMTAVGATNVGSIRVSIDKDLSTNVTGWKKGTHHDHAFLEPQHVGKGQLFGEFNLGSTVVLIFEAPKEFKFKLESSQKIKFGESLNELREQELESTFSR